MSLRPFARVAGEAFDADYISLPCEDCGRSEFGCECHIEEPCCDFCDRPLPENRFCLSCQELTDTVVTDIGDGWKRVAS
jgi:hypothetical protein